MRFSILLYGFHVLLRITSFRNASFREHVKGQDFSMLIRTADGRRARRYMISGGNISSRRGSGTADFSLIWKDAATGYRAMISMKPKALMHAIGDGSLKLEGDAGKVTSFLSLYKELLSCYR